ncbi:MAG: siphovirus Gp157 family protein [Candidatus Poribacteria bacterium]|nr:siphovirus Gp157 family protein [Candidatus Poribacteria bacterium]
MRKHTSQEHDTFFDIKREIRSIVGAITKAQAKGDRELVSERTDELIALIDKHEDKYALYADVIKKSIDGARESKKIARPHNAKARALNELAELLKQRLKDDMKQRNLKEVETRICTIRIVKDDIPTVIVNIPAEQLPERFQRVEPNKIKLRSAIIDEEEVEGVTLELGEHIKIYRY